MQLVSGFSSKLQIPKSINNILKILKIHVSFGPSAFGSTAVVCVVDEMSVLTCTNDIDHDPETIIIVAWGRGVGAGIHAVWGIRDGLTRDDFETS